MKISIVFPTRNRPGNLRRLISSLHSTSIVMPEVVVYVDDDDPTLSDAQSIKELTVVSGPRQILSKCWNDCLPSVTGDILMMGGDDLIFRTMAWDRMVVEEFEKYSDRLIFLHGHDGVKGAEFGTHGFLHQNWIKVVGYFAPPYFISDYNDTWLNDVSNNLNRRVFINILTEHMHPAWNKGPWDQTHMERLDRAAHADPGILYTQLTDKRNEDIQKLRQAIN